MKKIAAPERDWLLVGSQSITISGIHSPPGTISGPVETNHGPESLLRDYGDEIVWSRSIESKAWIHDLHPETPQYDDE